MKKEKHHMKFAPADVTHHARGCHEPCPRMSRTMPGVVMHHARGCHAPCPRMSTSQISPNVDVHAIMDDISLTGDAQELSVAVPVMITELAKVGLRINLKKSV
ncbi:Hypothetical protein, putative, partial [Bodo saltans]